MKFDSPSDTTIGQSYSVPCVFMTSNATYGTGWIPVLSPAHSDPEIGVPGQHYHPDFRFVPQEMFDRAESLRGERKVGDVVWTNDSSAVELREMECLRKPLIFPAQNPHRKEEGARASFPLHWEDMERKYSVCRINLNDPVCPHRGICLKGAPVVDGVIVCPGHGLGWDAQTGQNVWRHTCIR
jgi:hypothetical protein